jgi:lipoyl(octanoyl) transferase
MRKPLLATCQPSSTQRSRIINPTCRLIIDPPASGAWNMAVDEVLWEWAADAGECCWRFYRWEEPTLSLGYFQDLDDRTRHDASIECPVVRRATGGGAILHQHELTYSFVLPAEHELAQRRQFLYDSVHKTLIATLGSLGIEAKLCGQSAVRQEANPFLCFQRRSPGDVLVGATKIAGSAQRRTKGAVLQHGSVLLGRSTAAPELEGLIELGGATISAQQLVDRWLERLSAKLNLRWQDEPLTQNERQQAAELVRDKYGSTHFLRKQRP